MRSFLKHIYSFAGLAVLSLLFTIAAFAQTGVIVPPTNDEMGALLAALGGLKGASAVAIAVVVVQGLMLLLRTSLGEMAGKWRLLIVYLLSIVSVVLALKVSGVDLGAALVHANTLAALQVFLNQVFKQFFQKAD